MNPPESRVDRYPRPARHLESVGPDHRRRVITMRAFFDAAPEISKQVPVLFGSVSEEGNRCFPANRSGVAGYADQELR